MKKLSLTIALATLTVFAACNKDDEKVFKNELTVGSETFDLVNAYYDDESEEHARVEFILTDGILSDGWATDHTVIAFIELQSDAAEFSAGSYQMINNQSVYEYFGYAEVYFGTQRINYPLGTIKVFGTEPNFRFEIDMSGVPFTNGRLEGAEEPIMVTGSFKGTFQSGNINGF
jgi:hypothetical protein